MIFIWILLGSSLGGLLRYLVQLACIHFGLAWAATLFVNTLGSLIAGFVISLTLTPTHADNLFFKYFLVIGFLGAFTTFSAFAIDVLHLLRSSQAMAAFTHVVLNVGCSITAVFIGFLVAQQFFVRDFSL